jgi:hypothetical protein
MFKISNFQSGFFLAAQKSARCWCRMRKWKEMVGKFLLQYSGDIQFKLPVNGENIFQRGGKILFKPGLNIFGSHSGNLRSDRFFGNRARLFGAKRFQPFGQRLVAGGQNGGG